MDSGRYRNPADEVDSGLAELAGRFLFEYGVLQLRLRKYAVFQRLRGPKDRKLAYDVIMRLADSELLHWFDGQLEEGPPVTVSLWQHVRAELVELREVRNDLAHGMLAFSSSGKPAMLRPLTMTEQRSEVPQSFDYAGITQGVLAEYGARVRAVSDQIEHFCRQPGMIADREELRTFVEQLRGGYGVALADAWADSLVDD